MSNQNIGNGLFTIGIFCIVNVIYNYTIFHTTILLVEKQTEIDNKLETIKNENADKNDVLLSLIKINENLFSDIRLLNREIAEMKGQFAELRAQTTEHNYYMVLSKEKTGVNQDDLEAK